MGSFRQLTTPRAMMILLPVGLVVAAVSGWRLWQESRMLEDSVQVRAEVLSARVVDFTTGTGTNRERHYRPEVRFRYRFEGETLESDRVTPLGDAGSRAWAEELVGRFPAGSAHPAWVPLDEPEAAYLVKIRSWKPPVGLGFGLLIAALTSWGLLRQRARSVA